jgi:hypothetical protein
MANFLARCWSKLFPISRGSESIEIQKGMTVQDGMRDTNNTLQPNERFLIEFISTQQISVIAEIAEEPAEPPERFGCAIDPSSECMVLVFFGFENRQSHEIERSGRMPTIERTFHTDEEDTLKLIGSVFAFAMKAWNMPLHEVTSCDLE